jgi:hypothetical protein
LDTLIKNFKILGYKIDLRKTGLHIVSINNDVMKIYIRENDTKDTINIDGQKSRSLYLMENYLSKSNCLVYLIFQIQIHYWLKIKLKKY